MFGEGKGSLPHAEELSHQVLSLPMHPYMDEATAVEICSAILDTLGAQST